VRAKSDGSGVQGSARFTTATPHIRSAACISYVTAPRRAKVAPCRASESAWFPVSSSTRDGEGKRSAPDPRGRNRSSSKSALTQRWPRHLDATEHLTRQLRATITFSSGLLTSRAPASPTRALDCPSPERAAIVARAMGERATLVGAPSRGGLFAARPERTERSRIFQEDRFLTRARALFYARLAFLVLGLGVI